MKASTRHGGPGFRSDSGQSSPTYGRRPTSSQNSPSKVRSTERPTRHCWKQYPTTNLAVSRLPDGQQRRLFDAFHLELRYDDRTSELDLRVTITGDTAAVLSATVQGILDSP